jgi:hypothetical protein
VAGAAAPHREQREVGVVGGRLAAGRLGFVGGEVDVVPRQQLDLGEADQARGAAERLGQREHEREARRQRRRQFLVPRERGVAQPMAEQDDAAPIGRHAQT